MEKFLKLECVNFLSSTTQHNIIMFVEKKPQHTIKYIVIRNINKLSPLYIHSNRSLVVYKLFKSMPFSHCLLNVFCHCYMCSNCLIKCLQKILLSQFNMMDKFWDERMECYPTFLLFSILIVF